MEWLGRAKINFTHAPNPRPMRCKDGTETDLLKICEETTPPCQLNPLLFNGHLQTMWTATKLQDPQVYYRRKIFQADHKVYRGTFAVDFTVAPFEDNDETLARRTVYFTDDEFDNLGSDDNKPMVVILPGLSGGSHEDYIRHVIASLTSDSSWESCVVNWRGCANSKITSGVLYNARSTWDLSQTVKWLRKTFPNRPLFGLGFSLGANMLTNYCGEEGSHCVLNGAIACSNPFNLELTSKMLQRNLIGREVYLRVMGTSMKSLVTTHRKEFQQYTQLDTAAIDKITYLHEFDRAVQCPTWGYPTEYAYYRDASSTDAVMAIRIPFMALHATDDPIAVVEAIPYAEFQQNPNTILVTTSLGGHLSWFEMGGSRWHARPLCNFLNHLAFKVDPESVNPLPEPLSVDESSYRIEYNPMRRKLNIME